MKAIIFALLMGWRKPFGICFVGVLFALGSAHADSGKGVPTKLKPLKPTPVESTPVPTIKAETPKDPTCVWVQRSTVNYAPGMIVATPGMLIDACGPVWLPGVFVSVPASEQTTTEYQQVCQ